MDALLSLLDKDVPENVKNCGQYFGLFSNFAQRVINRQQTSSVQYSASKHETKWLLRWFSQFFVFSLSGLRSVPVVAETLSLSPDALLPAGTQQAKQPGRTAKSTEFNRTVCIGSILPFELFIVLRSFECDQHLKMTNVDLRLRNDKHTALIAHNSTNCFSVCLYRTGGGVQLRRESSFTSTAPWPSSRYTLTSTLSGRRVRHLNQIHRLTSLMFLYEPALILIYWFLTCSSRSV